MSQMRLWRRVIMPVSKKADPTGQYRNRRRAYKALAKRLNKSMRDVDALFKAIPNEKVYSIGVVNSGLVTNEVGFAYQLNDQQLQELSLEIASILNFNLDTYSGTMPPDWFFKEFVEVAYRSGAFDDFRDTERAVKDLKDADIISTGIGDVVIDPTSITESIEYQRKLASKYIVNYAEIKSLSQKTAASVFGEIQRGVLAGENPKTVRRAIIKRFSVSKSDALRLARTEINGAYNDAKLDLTDEMEKTFDVALANLHISALLSTTRATHAARHGNAYSSIDQRQWWASSANRINCYCTTQKVVIDKNGNVLNKELQNKVKEEGKTFFEN
jgi:hypothetical protein